VDSEAWRIASADSSRYVLPPPTRTHAFALHCIQIILVQPAGIPPHLAMSLTPTDTATLVEILRATVYSRSTTNAPLSAMHLHVPTPNSTPAKVSHDPFVKSTVPDLLRPLSTLFLPTAVVLKSDVAAISALGLSEAWSWRIAAKVALGLTKFDTIFEHQALEHHFNVYDELGILLHQPKGTPAPQKQKRSICMQNCFKLYLVHSKESPAADWITLTASTQCVV